jgi:PEP-CTERM motif
MRKVMKSSMGILLAVLMMVGFTSTSFGATIWATDYEFSLLVANPGNALGAPDGKYATIGSLTVTFGTQFLDLTGNDVVVVDAIYDATRFVNVGDIYTMTARRAGTGIWSDLVFDESFGGYRFLEIDGGYSGAFDAVNLTYIAGGTIGDLGLEIDAVGVANAVPEPGALALLGSGLVGLVFWGRKRTRK